MPNNDCIEQLCNAPNIQEDIREEPSGVDMNNVASESTASDDFDHDGVYDASDLCPWISDSLQSDLDHDGVGDACDNCVYVFNANQENVDNDIFGDVCDEDIDQDSILNNDDNCSFVSNQDQRDFDHDNMGDVCDDDCDNDGIPNVVDVCVYDIQNLCKEDIDQDGFIEFDNCPYVYNPDLNFLGQQFDVDQDGLGDVCDPDADNDSILNSVDNCVYVFNTNQLDTDKDLMGDACDSDNCLYVDQDSVCLSMNSRFSSQFLIPHSVEIHQKNEISIFSNRPTLKHKFYFDILEYPYGSFASIEPFFSYGLGKENLFDVDLCEEKNILEFCSQKNHVYFKPDISGDYVIHMTAEIYDTNNQVLEKSDFEKKVHVQNTLNNCSYFSFHHEFLIILFFIYRKLKIHRFVLFLFFLIGCNSARVSDMQLIHDTQKIHESISITGNFCLSSFIKTRKNKNTAIVLIQNSLSMRINDQDSFRKKLIYELFDKYQKQEINEIWVVFANHHIQIHKISTSNSLHSIENIMNIDQGPFDFEGALDAINQELEIQQAIDVHEYAHSNYHFFIVSDGRVNPVCQEGLNNDAQTGWSRYCDDLNARWCVMELEGSLCGQYDSHACDENCSESICRFGTSYCYRTKDDPHSLFNGQNNQRWILGNNYNQESSILNIMQNIVYNVEKYQNNIDIYPFFLSDGEDNVESDAFKNQKKIIQSASLEQTLYYRFDLEKIIKTIRTQNNIQEDYFPERVYLAQFKGIDSNLNGYSDFFEEFHTLQSLPECSKNIETQNFIDTDLDGINDCEEKLIGTNFNDPMSDSKNFDSLTLLSEFSMNLLSNVSANRCFDLNIFNLDIAGKFKKYKSEKYAIVVQEKIGNVDVWKLACFEVNYISPRLIHPQSGNVLISNENFSYFPKNIAQLDLSNVLSQSVCDVSQTFY